MVSYDYTLEARYCLPACKAQQMDYVQSIISCNDISRHALRASPGQVLSSQLLGEIPCVNVRRCGEMI